ncbi:hypothetical protein PG984_013890 [Apiospora sp. TS-2023a]
MKQLPPHLQIFTPESSATVSCPEFVLFSLLPTELRQKIWQHSVQRPRILRLKLTSHEFMNLFLSVEGKERSEANGAPCAIWAGTNGLFSKLLRVNRDARDAALSFYKAHLSCRLAKDGEKLDLGSVEGALYINPDFDFIQLTGDMDNNAAPFLHHFKTVVDPSRRGVRNLALSMNCLLNLYRGPGREAHDVDVGRSMAETLRNLDEVWFVDRVGTGRFIPGLVRALKPDGAVFTRSYPLSTCDTVFERLPRDPRPIEAELAQVYVDRGLVDSPRKWAHVMDRWGVVGMEEGDERRPTTNITTTTTKYRYHLSCSSFGDPIRDRASAEAALWREDDYFCGRVEKSICSRADPIPCTIPKFRDEDLSKPVRPALGFWLFPIDQIPEDTDCPGAINIKDLSGGAQSCV